MLFCKKLFIIVFFLFLEYLIVHGSAYIAKYALERFKLKPCLKHFALTVNEDVCKFCSIWKALCFFKELIQYSNNICYIFGSSHFALQKAFNLSEFSHLTNFKILFQKCCFLNTNFNVKILRARFFHHLASWTFFYVHIRFAIFV